MCFAPRGRSASRRHRLVQPGPAVKAWEHLISTSIWILVALHLLGWLPRVAKAVDAFGYSFGTVRVSLLTVFELLLVVGVLMVLAGLATLLVDRDDLQACQACHGPGNYKSPQAVGTVLSLAKTDRDFRGLDKGGLVTLAYVMMVPSLGLALGVGQCANPNGSIGISRALTAMFAYDIPFILVIFGVAYQYGTTSLTDVIAIQQQHGIASWGILQMPLLFIAGLITLPALMGKQPYEIYVAPAEIATGPMVEMGGKFMGGLFVMQCFQLYTAGVLYTTLFLGGGTPTTRNSRSARSNSS